MPRAAQDAEQALGIVMERATSAETQQACLRALRRKNEILWHLLDAIERAGRGAEAGGDGPA